MHDQESGDHTEIMHYSTRVDRLVHDHTNENRYDHALNSLLFLGSYLLVMIIIMLLAILMLGPLEFVHKFCKGKILFGEKISGQGCAERARRLLANLFGVGAIPGTIHAQQ